MVSMFVIVSCVVAASICAAQPNSTSIKTPAGATELSDFYLKSIMWLGYLDSFESAKSADLNPSNSLTPAARAVLSTAYSHPVLTSDSHLPDSPLLYYGIGYGIGKARQHNGACHGDPSFKHLEVYMPIFTAKSN